MLKHFCLWLALTLLINAFFSTKLLARTALSTKESQINNVESDNFYRFKLLMGGYSQSRAFYGNDDVENGALINLALDFEYEDFFMDSSNKNRGGGLLGRVYLGYHLWQDEKVAWDIIAGSYTPEFPRLDKDDRQIPALRNIGSREEDFGLGVRYSRLFGDQYFSIEVVKDVSSQHEGYIFDSYLSKVMSYGNWDFVYGVGHTWFSSQTTNFYIGLEDHEIVNQWQPYNTGASYIVSLELSAEYPISESWVFESGFSYSWLSDNLTKSPLVTKNYDLAVILGFAYVF